MSDTKKKSPALQGRNTILNYFTKTPKKATDSPDGKTNKTPFKVVNSAEAPKKSSTPTMVTDTTPKVVRNRKSQLNSSTPNESFKSPKVRKMSNDKPNGYQLFDLVWAKLDGYPWWPSLICEAPNTNKFERASEIHVQFFDDPVTHAWIKKRDIKPYTGSIQPGISLKSGDKKLKMAIEFAEEALDIEREARFKLIGDLNFEEANFSNEMSVDSEPSTAEDKPTSNKTPSKRKKNISIIDDEEKSSGENTSDNENISLSTQKKRFKRILIDSSDEEEDAKRKKDEDEYKPKDEESSDESVASDVLDSDDLETASEVEEDESLEEIKKKPVKAAKSKSNNKSTAFKSFSMSVSKQTNNTTQAVTHIEAVDRNWPHLSFPFLQPDKICDLNRQKMLINGELNLEYDSSTLYVPRDFLNQQTPAQRQWWELKASHFDTILFFKMGKFYELFHMDAVVATKELQILFMKGDYAHAGFPEKSYKRYADVLIQKGYKVARVEQTETPAMMEKRTKGDKKCTKFDKVVNREICRVSSVGTRYMSDIDSDALTFSNSYLYAFSCMTADDGYMEFGISFVDVSVGKVYLTQFKDDRHYSKLRTVLSHYTPSEIIFAGTSELGKLLEIVFPNAPKQNRRKFWSAGETLQYISEKKIWDNVASEFRNQILSGSGVLEQACLPEYELAVSSFGGIIQYLERALIADDILSMGLFEVYNPLESSSNILSPYLILDAVTMKNLEVLQNLRGENSASLFKIVNNCCTPFGKRLLRTWLCLPLCNQREELELRQEAVRDLAENTVISPEISGWRSILQKLPDLERLLTQIHSQSSLKRARDHPDSRAILFESHIYRRRRITNFLNTLDGFEKIVQLMEQVSSLSGEINSKLLNKLVSFQANGGSFPEMHSKIVYFRNAFDAEKARMEGNIIPQRGADAEYDDAVDEIEAVKQKLDEYLNVQKLFFKVRVAYQHQAKNRYMLEVADSGHSKTLNSTEKYEQKGQRKGFKRYHTNTIINLVGQLEKAEAKLATSQSDICRRFLEKFDHDYQLWSRAIKCVATLDALISLSKTKQTFETHDSCSCLPEFIWTFDQSGVLLYAEELRNACLIESRELIANNVELKNGTMVLTGPNMAGKTTLMRSVGLVAILAQIGAYVPASRCRMTPVDRIFTRIGAYDQVIESQSTFMVELSETVTIVQHATANSLVLIDELGRGTSTFDGIAIAQSVLEELAEAIQCRCIFSTHFHSIVDELQHLPSISVAHMAYVVENENKEDPTDEDVIFLYKLTQGVCNQSYGYNVARLAGIERDILRNAYKYGHAFELKVESCRLLDAFMQAGKSPSQTPLSEKKLDQLAQYLSEIVITRQSNNIKCI